MRAVAVPSLLLGLLLGLLAGCGPGGPERLPLNELAANPERYDGDELTTTGTVREFGPDEGALERHLVIESPGQDRVLLEPLNRAEPYIGQRVEVTGQFTFDESVGRRLRISEIAPAS